MLPQISNHLKLAVFLTFLFISMLTIKPDTVPSPWFDEGWTLATARNWVEHGKYALRLGDDWVSAETMAQPFTVTMPIAASFKIFGIGVVQGRLPNMLYTIGVFAWLFAIAKQLYNNRVAWGVMLVTLLLPPSLEIQPFIVGRQSLGEIPMLFFLLGGYWFMYQALKQPRSIFILICASLFWGLAIITKRQPLPFWALSVLLPLLLTIKNKDYPTSKSFTLVIIGTGIFAILFTLLENNLLASAPIYGARVSSSYIKLLVWNPNLAIRSATISGFVVVGIFPLLGIIYVFKKSWNSIKSETQSLSLNWVEFSLWSLTCSWTIWYLIGSWGWLRYYMPAYIISFLFFTKALHDWTEGFNLRTNIKKLLATIPRTLKNLLPQLGIILILAISIIPVWINVNWFLSMKSAMPDQSIYTLTDYIHANTTSNTVIETYEGELLFMLTDRLTHFPPHKTQEVLNRRTFLNEDVTITYDPIIANPDLLIVGTFGRMWHLYDPWLDDPAFRLVTQIGRYDIYRRVR